MVKLDKEIKEGKISLLTTDDVADAEGDDDEQVAVYYEEESDEQEQDNEDQLKEDHAIQQDDMPEMKPTDIIPISSQSKNIQKTEKKLKLRSFSKRSREEWEEMHDLITLIKGKKCEVRRLESELKQRWGDALEIPEPETPPMPIDTPNESNEIV